MRRFIYILLFLLLTLPFRDGLGISSMTYASYFEVQVPMADHQKQFGEQQIMPKGHFSTNVSAIDEYGHAYSPGNTATANTMESSGPRRVGVGGLPPDPVMPPVGDIPWVLLVILIIVYIAAIVPRTHSRRTFKLLLNHLSRVEQWRKILKK